MGRITQGPGPSTVIPKLAPEEIVSPTGETIVYVDRVQYVEVPGPERIVYIEAPPSVEIQEKVVIEYRDVPIIQEVVKEIEKIVYIDKPVVKIKEVIKAGPERIVHVEDITRIRELENRNKELESRLNKAGVIVILLVMSLILGVMYVQ